MKRNLKHGALSPHPWRLVPRGKSVDVCNGIDCTVWHRAFIVDATGNTLGDYHKVAQLVGGNPHCDANARALVAAPELLRQLKKNVDTMLELADAIGGLLPRLPSLESRCRRQVLAARKLIDRIENSKED